MRIDVVTIFPGMFAPVIQQSILKRAQASGRVQIAVHDLRQWTRDRRRTVDDRPFGGGPGMLMKPEPLWKAVEAIEASCHGRSRRTTRARCHIVLLGPAGERLDQALARRLARARRFGPP